MVVTDCSISGDAFAKMRQDFDKILADTITKMKQKGSTDASITIKLDVELETTFAPVEELDGSRSSRDVYIPHFSHKVTSAMQIKQQIAGQCEEECEIIWDSENQKYILIPIGQMTLDAEYNREDDFYA